jgi:hypothetical protein
MEMDMDKSFKVAGITRSDLEANGFDVSEVDDETMDRIASFMHDDYLNQLYWSSMDAAAEYLGIRKTNEETEE